MSKLITIKKSTIFKDIYKNGYTVKNSCFTLKFLPSITTINNKNTSNNLLNNTQFGFIISKKIGCAVKRNYIRRRLKEAIKLCLASFEINGFYIFIVNKELFSLKFDSIVQYIEHTLIKLKNF